MRRSHIELFRLAGIPIRLHVSWFAIAILVVWTLATSAFPAESPGLSAPAYWLMGVAGALGLFTSIVIHESCHALVARRDGIPMSGITLFVFGGVAEMEGEPATPGAELRMAAAGPAASVALALLGYGAVALAGDVWPGPLVVVIRYLALFNAVLAGFNLVPGFPLDGGRMLRAALWQRSGDLQRATRIASRVGSAFGVVLLSLGVLGVVTGALVSGLWWILIGLFVRTAASQSYTQVRVRYLLERQTVRDFTTPAPATVPPGLSVAEFLQQYGLRHGAGLLPVADDGRLLGSVTASRLMGALPRSAWDRERVDGFVEPGGADTVVAPDTGALQALGIMTRAGRPRLLVVEGGRLLGMVSQRDLLDYCSAAMELEARPGATSARSTSP